MGLSVIEINIVFSFVHFERGGSGGEGERGDCLIGHAPRGNRPKKGY